MTKPPLWYVIQAIVGTLLEEAILVVVVLWVLPIFDIHVSWWLLVLLGVALAVFAYITYRIGRSTFFVKRRVAPEALIGSEGRVIKSLSPIGYIKIRGELWKASCLERELNIGDEVIVAETNGIKLIVRPKCNDNGGQNELR